jgi:uncharacterized membrane protein YhhN
MYRVVLLAFIAAIADLVLAAHGWNAPRITTKPLPALLLAIAVFGSRGVPRAFGLGLLLAAAGDELLLFAGDAPFVAGVSCFAGMHLCYIAGFARTGTGMGLVRRFPWLLAPYALAVAGVNALLWHPAGRFALPLAVYSVLLGAMAVAALNAAGRVDNNRAARMIVAGALIFMGSDTLLAFVKFWPWFPLTGLVSEITIVGTYFIAQIAIVTGLLVATDE